MRNRTDKPTHLVWIAPQRRECIRMHKDFCKVPIRESVVKKLCFVLMRPYADRNSTSTTSEVHVAESGKALISTVINLRGLTHHQPLTRCTHTALSNGTSARLIFLRKGTGLKSLRRVEHPWGCMYFTRTSEVLFTKTSRVWEA